MFEKIIEEVKAIDLEIVQECTTNSRVKELYLGTQIFFGPFYEGIGNEPTILFIGINPSSVEGDAKLWRDVDVRWEDENEKRHNYKEMSDGLQYIAYRSELGNSVKKIFGEEKRYLLADSSSKINCYPFATKGQKELENLLNSLPSNLRNKVVELSKEWLVEVIGTLKPLLIFYEGKYVFDFLKKTYLDKLATDEQKMLELKNNQVMQTTLNVGGGEDYIDVLIAERNRSRFLNPELCKQKIDEWVKTYNL
ncbi:hypothetical protein AGMMS50267_16070 [Spirochaetia bacterium]|nr:hypothetical protein AGMMS50267_16070 [Spirochaetia bacterium]